MIWRWHLHGLGSTGKQETPIKWSLALWKPSVDNFPGQLLFIFINLLLKMTFPPENTYFLVLIKYAALGCILQCFESKLTDNWVHVTIPCIWCLIFHKRFQGAEEADAVESCLKKMFSLFFLKLGHIRIQLLLINFSVSLLSHLAYHMMDLNCQCTCYFALHCGSQQLCPQGQASLLMAFLYSMYSKLAHLLWCYQIKSDCNVCLGVTWHKKQGIIQSCKW